VLEQARRMSRPAVEAVIRSVYPAVHRMAHGLAGREDVARGIIRFVASHAPRQMPRWKDPEAPDRWFYHHTVLTARRASRHRPEPMRDLLLGRHGGDARYVAFIRALRELPIQQREAFILHYGEQLDIRRMAIAMDCSTQAAELHLRTGDAALRALAGKEFAAMTARLREVYRAMAPTEDAMGPAVRMIVARSLWARRLWRLVKWLLLAGLAAGAGWGVWGGYIRIFHF